MDLDEVEAVLEVIQEFDPLGVGARDIRECLLIQARHYFPRDDLVRDLIAHHLENLERQKIEHQEYALLTRTCPVASWCPGLPHL